MNLVLRIDNNIIALIVSIIFLKNISCSLDKTEKRNTIFALIFKLNTIELTIETLTCIINKQPYIWLIPVTTILHIILFVLAPLVTYHWYVFARLWISKDADYKYKNNILSLLPIIINTILVLPSPFFKLTFYINAHNTYERGTLFFIPFVVSYFYLLCGFIIIYKNRRNLNRMEFFPLVLFGIFPTLASLIQFAFYGPLLMWSSISFSLIILYLYLQQQMMHIDYLTGAWTREKFSSYLNNKIKQKKYLNFSIVIIDLDDFKKINDDFGHSEGDKALIALVSIVKNLIGNKGSITRYGGDEFILLLNISSEQEIEAVLLKISNALTDYINRSNLSYKLSFSYGYEVYDFNKNIGINDYINHADRLMYQNKNSKKNRQSSNIK
ncbi:GGDEF domain-containing protein [Clostridium guangxiense]|uniref:GGDEF domain-containing protein n=1 Tax=Clostridium guangxiense TaxID=1662055 RepID=UPI001E600658|nr:diguanylate cyclase [Clostridium guangxiense]MCD2345606.1 diguanylate cyclase [Clostridium guangxiense]